MEIKDQLFCCLVDFLFDTQADFVSLDGLEKYAF